MPSSSKQLDHAVVGLIVDIESRLIRNIRSPEVSEYRRGYEEALNGLKNDVPMLDVIDALKAAGWQPPRRGWVAPAAAEAQ